MNRALSALLFATLPACSAFQPRVEPLRFIERPIAFETVSIGICTGDRLTTFYDRRGERFELRIINPRIRLGEPPTEKPSRSVVSVVHRGSTIPTSDGDYAQSKLIILLSEASTKLRTKRHRSEDEDWRLRYLGLLIDDLRARQQLKNPE